ELTLGDSFLTFMNQALTISDYCLLLWSRSAAATPWVEMEWQSALHRSVREKRGFIVVGRLEATNVPALLEPRLRIDLFPTLEPGITALVNSWCADRTAATLAAKPVGAATIDVTSGVDGGDSVYIDSEQFTMISPVGVKVDEPAGVFLDRII